MGRKSSLAGCVVLAAASAATLHAQSALDGFDPNANETVRVVVVQLDGKILIGGDFITLSPNGGATVTRNRIARLTKQSLEDTFVPKQSLGPSNGGVLD